MTGFLFFAIWFLIYFLCAVPSLHFEDNPEFITTAYTLGVVHPTGYPLVNLLGNLSGFAPVGGFAFRTNILSSLFCAGAVWLFYLSAVSLTGRKNVSIAAAILFGLSGNLWAQASIFEVYPLHYLFFFGILYIALSGLLRDFRWLLFTSFLFGLGVSNHVSLSLGLVPFTILWLGEKENWRYKMNLPRSVMLPSVGLLAWGVQLYLPARSLSDNPDILFGWGRMEGVGHFVSYITGQIYAGLPFNSWTLENRFQYFVDYVSISITWVPLIALLAVAIFGLKKMIGGDRHKAVALVSGIALFWVYTLIQRSNHEMLSVLPWGLLLLCCAKYVASLSAKRGAQIVVALSVFSLPYAAFQYQRYDFHDEWLSYDYLADVQDTLPEGDRLHIMSGLESNFIILYGEFGPAKANRPSLTHATGQLFTTALSVDENTKQAYGLLNTANISTLDVDGVWDHLRTFTVHDISDHIKGLPEKVLFHRDVFKSEIFTRIALQRGYYLFQKGEVAKAEKFFKTAAALDPQGELQIDAVIWHSWGNNLQAKMLIESMREVKPSPGLSQLIMLLDKEL